MQPPTPLPEHEWLHRLVGDWTWTMEADMGPDQPTTQDGGTESVRSLGGLWTIGEGVMSGGAGRSVMTLGYDPMRKKFVGTFVASMMMQLWVYSGSLDADQRVLTLDAEGPSFTGDGSIAQYQDVIEFLNPDTRILTSRMQRPDGTWHQFMKATYTRQRG